MESLILGMATLLAVPGMTALAEPRSEEPFECGQPHATGICRDDCGDFPCCHHLWVLGENQGVVFCEV